MKKIIIGSIIAFGGLLTVQAQCKTVSSINENFDNWKDVDKCWKADGGEAMLYHKEGRIVFYSMMNPEESMTLSTPKVKAGKYSLSFDALNNGSKATLILYRIENPSDLSTLKTISKEIEITEGTRNFTVTLPVDAHIGFKVVLTGIHHAFYIDNVALKVISE